MFGRATIRLGIGPHSSCYCYHVRHVPYVASQLTERGLISQNNVDVELGLWAFVDSERHRLVFSACTLDVVR